MDSELGQLSRRICLSWQREVQGVQPGEPAGIVGNERMDVEDGVSALVVLQGDIQERGAD